MTAVRAIIAVLVTVGTAAIVFGVKRGSAWWIKDWSLTSQEILLVILLALALLAVAWTNLLRPAIERRKQRERARLGQSAEGYSVRE